MQWLQDKHTQHRLCLNFLKKIAYLGTLCCSQWREIKLSLDVHTNGTPNMRKWQSGRDIRVNYIQLNILAKRAIHDNVALVIMM